MNAVHYARLVKIDEAARKVTGVAIAEELDRSREVFDYDTSKPYFEAWSADVSKASDGKSLGNVREMHGMTAAGRVTELEFNDAAKSITIEVDVVDDAAWNKVLKGVYTGFSLGGKYIKKWTDAEGNKRYTAEPREMSLVDLPCVKTATFDLVKADGAIEATHFDASVTADEADVRAALAKALSADDEGEQTPTVAEGTLRVREAFVEKFVGGDWMKFAAVVTNDSQEDLAKGAWSIRMLADMAASCLDLVQCRAYEVFDTDTQQYKPVTQQLKDAATALYDALLAIVSEDAAKAKEMIAAKCAESDDLRKRADTEGEELRKMAGLGEVLTTLAKGIGTDDPALFVESVTKLANDHSELRKNFDDLKSKYDAAPSAGKGVLRVVEKTATAGDDTGNHDGSTATSAEQTPEEVTKSAFQTALSKGVRIADLGEFRKA
jgi:hypothetical protein